MFKNLKSLFFVEEENAEATSPTAAPVRPPASPMPSASAIPPAKTPAPTLSGNANLDQRIFDSLQKTIEDNNLEGFDFLEFRNSLKTLNGIISDEATRYKSAYATAATMGVTVEKLLESGRFYISILEKERDNFNKAVDQQVDQNITTKKNEVSHLQHLIGQKSEEIARLSKEIAAHQEEMANAQSIISEAEVKIASTKNNFHLTLDTVVNQLGKDMNNIEKYLKPNNPAT